MTLFGRRVTPQVTVASTQSGVGGRGEGQPGGRPGRLLVVPLGEASRADVEAALVRQFGPGVSLEWFARGQLRGSPLAVARGLANLWRTRHAAAVLVAPDLQQPRLRLTSLVLCAVRAEHKWRVDLRGNREVFATRAHVARNIGPVLRHLAACAAARLLGEPMLRLIDRLLQPRRTELMRPWAHAQRWPLSALTPAPTIDGGADTELAGVRRMLYLRSQLWLGLAGGGSVAHTAGVIGGLEQAGVEVQVVSSDWLAGVNAATRIVAPETWFDGPLRELEDVAYNVAFFVAAWQAARRARPQVIYQRHTAFNCAGAVLSRVLRLPLVLEFNSSELWKGRYWGGLHFRTMAGLVERINLRAADRIVVVSEVLRTQLVQQGVVTDKILVNPNAVDPDVFGPRADGSGTALRQRLGFSDVETVIGFSGTFGMWHGIPTLAAALPLVVAARPNARWLLIGDGALRALVDQAIAAHGLQERVVLTGLVPHGEMPAYLAACDVLVSPHGRQADGGEFFGSPTKLFEYMAGGRPIVASAVGQIADVLEHERTALLVQPDDAVGLCEAVVRLIDDADLRARLARQVRQAAVERHTWRQNAERLLGSLR
jgi:glycosyltransferase involved in cell wall biosynthesis